MSKDKYLSTFSPLMDAIVIIILQAFEQLGPDLFPKARSLENWGYSQIFPVLAEEYCHVTC